MIDERLMSNAGNGVIPPHALQEDKTKENTGQDKEEQSSELKIYNAIGTIFGNLVSRSNLIEM